MHKLHHFKLCPYSRSIRIALHEVEIPVEFIDEQPWNLQPAFLSLNPAGDLPVLVLDSGPCLCGAYSISEFIAEELRRRPHERFLPPFFPGNREEKAEVRRLVDWSHKKLDREVTRELLIEKVFARLEPGSRHVPDAELLRALASSLRYHMSYFNYLAQGRKWLAGEDMSFADIAAAAHLSVIDYMGEVRWDEFPFAKEWYARIKSRPSMRSILAEKIAGVAPPVHYADLDF